MSVVKNLSGNDLEQHLRKKASNSIHEQIENWGNILKIQNNIDKFTKFYGSTKNYSIFANRR